MSGLKMPFQPNPELESRCKNYNTTLNNCSCMSFNFRKYCKHISYLVEKIAHKSDQMEIIASAIPDEGLDMMDAFRLYGEKTVDELKALQKCVVYRQKLIPMR